MADKKDYSKVKIINIMADGTVRGSVKGYIEDASQLSFTTRRLLTEMLTPCKGEYTDSTTEV